MFSLYIHIPFCHSKCAYCDFFSTPSLKLVDDYFSALKSELHLRLPSSSTPRTIYIGGGTPSILPHSMLSQLLEMLPLHSAVETTVEVNPEDVTPELASLLANVPNIRVSMGVQSFIDSELTTIGRRHTSAKAIAAYRTLCDASITNISLDLIFGLPGQTIQSWERSVSTLFDLRPAHFSTYSLMLEQGTRLWAMTETGRIPTVPQELSEMMYRIICHEARCHGYNHYEISNFALPQLQSRHNSAYWDFTPYIGIGASAHSFDGVATRTFNTSSIQNYISNRRETIVTEHLSPYDIVVERIMLSLRTSQGLSLSDYAATTSQNEAARLLRAARKHINAGILHINNDTGTISFNEDAWLIADSIIVDIMPDNISMP